LGFAAEVVGVRESGKVLSRVTRGGGTKQVPGKREMRRKHRRGGTRIGRETPLPRNLGKSRVLAAFGELQQFGGGMETNVKDNGGMGGLALAKEEEGAEGSKPIMYIWVECSKKRPLREWRPD